MTTAYRQLLALALCLLATAAAAAEPAEKVRPQQERCIFLPQVRNVDIVDDKTLIWHMSGGPHDAYKMTLAFRCTSLKFRDAFVHSSATSRLCDTGEWVRVVGQSHQTCPIERIEPWVPPEKEKNTGE